MREFKVGFYHSNDNDLATATYIGSSCTDAMEWMKDNLDHRSVAEFLSAYITDDACVFEVLSNYFWFILDHDVWAFVEDCLECLGTGWFGSIRYLCMEVVE